MFSTYLHGDKSDTKERALDILLELGLEDTDENRQLIYDATLNYEVEFRYQYKDGKIMPVSIIDGNGNTFILEKS